MYRPECPACQMCQAVRVSAEAFRPRRSHRRILKANDPDVSVIVSTPSPTEAKQQLYISYHEHQQRAKGWPPEYARDPQALGDWNPFPIEEWSYLVEGRLVGLGYVDVLPTGLSAIYFGYDPSQRRRSLGIFNVLSILAAAKRLGLPHVYLGFYVEGCSSLDYMRDFRPAEVLRPDGQWVPLA